MASESPFSILPNTHLPHEDFASHAALEARLRATVRGEVRFDPASRALYTPPTLPTIVSFPSASCFRMDADDAIATVAACHVSLALPSCRAAAAPASLETAANVAVVLDFSKHMRRIVAMDYAGRNAPVSSRASSWTRCAPKPNAASSPLPPTPLRTAVAPWAA